MAVKKSRKCSGSVIYSYFVDSAFIAVKRNAELTNYVKGVLFINIRYTKGLPFLSKMVFNPLSPNIQIQIFLISIHLLKELGEGI